MGPAFETFLTVFIPLATSVGVAAYFTRHRWRAFAARLSEWQREDARREAVQRAEEARDRAQAEKARAEVQEWGSDDLDPGPTDVKNPL